MAGNDVHLERVHDEVRAREQAERKRPEREQGPPPGQCFLVDRLWPRGVRKEALGDVAWVRDVAPSDELRKWFGHDPRRFEEFADRYRAELDARPEEVEPLLEAVRQGPVNLLYAARDTERNHAVVLRDYLEERLSPASGSN